MRIVIPQALKLQKEPNGLNTLFLAYIYIYKYYVFCDVQEQCVCVSPCFFGNVSYG